MVFGGTRRRGLNNTPMSEDGSPFQSRGMKARREGVGNQDNPRDEKFIRSVLEHDEQLEEVCLSIAKTSGECIPSISFIIKVRRVLRAKPQRSAQYYINVGGRGPYAPPRVHGAAPFGDSPSRGQGAASLAHPRPGQGGGAPARGRTFSKNPCVWAGAVV